MRWFLIAAIASLRLSAQSACTSPPSSALRVANVAVGSPGYVTIPDSPTLRPTALSVEAWVTPRGSGVGSTSDPYGASIVAKTLPGATGSLGDFYLASWELRWNPGNGQFLFGITDVRDSRGISSGSVARVFTTAHVALTFDGANLRFYVNGALDVTVAYPHPIYYDSEPVLIGAAEHGQGRYRRFDGEIDAVRIWDHARSNEQILGSMHRRIGSEPGLVASYTFDRGDATDSSGNQNHGTLVGPATSFTTERVALATQLGCPRLSADIGRVSQLTGGTQQLVLQGTPAQAGDLYLLLGSTGQTLPGFTFNSLQVPLEIDAYTQLTLQNFNAAPIFVGTAGTLDANSRARASIQVPALPFIGDVALKHAYVTISPQGSMSVSQPVPLALRL